MVGILLVLPMNPADTGILQIPWVTLSLFMLSPYWRVFRSVPMSTIQPLALICWPESNPGRTGTLIQPVYPPLPFSVISSSCTLLSLAFRRFLTYIYLAVRYYRLFMYYYAISLRTPSFVMVNSSWTKAHVDAILRHSDLLLDGLHLLPPLVFIKLFTSRNTPSSARIVYPPCDTREMATFPLTPRQRIILSVAQFRFALASLFFLHAQ